VPSTIPAPPTIPAAAQPTRIALAGSAKTGLSKAFTLPGGTYEFVWTITAPTGGCGLHLYLTPKKSGPSLASAEVVISRIGPVTGRALWSNVKAGTYLVEEDRTGSKNCMVAWKATLTAQ
jgi:hypothetical protein